MYYTVIGAGKSGVAAALLAKRLGHDVFLTESKPKEHYPEAAQTLHDNGIEAEFGGHSARALASAECVITSPGVPPHAAIIVDAEQRNIPIISELEFASRFLDNPIIAITGTNGKTTTTTLTAYILNQAGKPAVVTGNIGTPLSSLVHTVDTSTIIVVEASSYQLDRIDTFCPDVAVILNITPDHLGYHGSFTHYCKAKWKISLNQNRKNVLILGADDSPSSECAAYTKAKVLHFGKNPKQQGAFLRDGRIIFNHELQEEELMSIDELRIPGIHNAYNSMAAALAARAFEVRNENIRDSLMSFSGVEHRLESVRTLHSIEFINDSKATNINATWYALGSFARPIVWIAGGRGDNNDYTLLDDSVRQHVDAIVAIGEESTTIFNHFSAMKRCVQADSLDAAVQAAYELAEPGGIVLFSPACKSFDMFVNYEHRGEVFKHIVSEL